MTCSWLQLHQEVELMKPLGWDVKCLLEITRVRFTFSWLLPKLSRWTARDPTHQDHRLHVSVSLGIWNLTVKMSFKSHLIFVFKLIFPMSKRGSLQSRQSFFFRSHTWFSRWVIGRKRATSCTVYSPSFGPHIEANNNWHTKARARNHSSMALRCISISEISHYETFVSFGFGTYKTDQWCFISS